MKQGEAKLEKEARSSKNWLEQVYSPRLYGRTKVLHHCIKPQSLFPKPLHSTNGLGTDRKNLILRSKGEAGYVRGHKIEVLKGIYLNTKKYTFPRET